MVLSTSSFGWLKFFNTFAVSILGVCVFFLFVQLQVVTYKMSKDEETIVELQDKLANIQTQSDQIDKLEEKVDQTQNLAILHMAGTFVLLTSILTMFHMANHLRNFNQPVVQRKIMAILWMSPIYGLTSFFSLLAPSIQPYMAILKDFYEAYVIFTFLSFLVAVLGRGKREKVVDLLENRAEHLNRPYRWLGCCFHMNPDESPRAKAKAVLLECQVLALQFVFVRPVTSLASFLVTEISGSGQNDGADNDGMMEGFLKFISSPQMVISLVENVSIFFAFVGLLKFYHATMHELGWCQPFSKFCCIKGVVFLTFWQGLLINIVFYFKSGNSGDSEDGTSPTMALQLQNVLICLEMLFFSICHWCAFPAEEWEEGYRRKNFEGPGMGFKDFASDLSDLVSSQRTAKEEKRAALKGDYIDASGGIDLPAPTLDSSVV